MSEAAEASRVNSLLTLIVNVLLHRQGHGMHGHGETVHIPFPFDEEDLKGGKSLSDTPPQTPTPPSCGA